MCELVKQTGNVGTTSGTLGAHVTYYENKLKGISDDFHDYKNVIDSIIVVRENLKTKIKTGNI